MVYRVHMILTPKNEGSAGRSEAGLKRSIVACLKREMNYDIEIDVIRIEAKIDRKKDQANGSE